MKAAVFSCKGLGDGLISIALANNLHINNYVVDVFHNSLDQMQSFFKNFSIKKYPDIQNIDSILSIYDQIFVSYDSSNDFVMQLIHKGKNQYSNKVFVLNPCPSKKIGLQPYYSDAYFDPKICMVDNIDFFSKKVLKLEKTTKNISFSISEKFVHKKYKKRVILHPSSAKESKNFSEKKYIKIALILKKHGYDPVFVVSKKEKKKFSEINKHSLELKSFDNLKDLTVYIYESFYMIGNDSGIGHLSSMLGLSTISIFRNYRSAFLWRPGWSKNIIIYPDKVIPNLSIYRLRDKHWKKFISSKRVLKKFLKNFL